MNPINLLNPELESRIQFMLYRYRFLLVYMAIGVFSLVLEFVTFRGLEKLGLPSLSANVVGVALGIYFAYFMNVRFNFKVPRAKRNRALVYFVIISSGSFTVNYIFKGQLLLRGWNPEVSRFVVAGVLFYVAYLFHRRFSFSDRKLVGVAIYANGVEDVKGIFEKIGTCPDFIHVDLIDETFGAGKAESPQTYRLETIRAYWPNKKIDAHIMSRTPSKWINDIAPHVDAIIVHIDVDEPIDGILENISKLDRQIGLCVAMRDSLDMIRPSLSHVDMLMILSIPEPGRSGQTFDMNALDWISEVNAWPDRSRIDFCVDGGVNERTVGLLNVEQVVSGSSVLNAPDPKRQIMRLQTSSNYERV